MTSLCIDELSGRLKQRWAWPASATHVPACADAPLLAPSPCERAALDDPSFERHSALPRASDGTARPSAVCAPLACIHGKEASSMG